MKANGETLGILYKKMNKNTILTIVLYVFGLFCVVHVVAIERKEVEIENYGDLPHDYKRPVTPMEQHYSSLRRLLAVPITGMNETCTTSLCEMMESAMSCKAIGFDLSKTCATYLLGFLYACPNFPAPNDIYNAPYVCLSEWGNLLPRLRLGTAEWRWFSCSVFSC